jgi:deoxyribodipyrimidine photo-lyase
MPPAMELSRAMSSILWFRQDLRLADNPALAAALQRGRPVIPVFLWSPEDEGEWSPGGASRWWLHQSLERLDAALRAAGSRLIVRRGPAEAALRDLVRETGARAVFWNRRYEPACMARDAKIKEALRTSGLEVESFNAALLHEPWTIRNKSDKPFQVFTPFWRHCLTLPDPPAPTPAPAKIAPPERWPATRPLAELALLPRINWTSGMAAVWQPGPAGAHAQLDRFVSGAFVNYSEARNRPDLAGTSRLSPHLHFGEISPREIWHALRAAGGRNGVTAATWRNSQFLAEVGWREFAHHLLYHFPHTPTEPLRAEFKKFPWRGNTAWLRAWQRGRTGIPLVDAGMRELWTTGWMHNRVRMVVASFLVKNLLISWRDGARWFWDTLVDADLAQNTLGWQWTAGCGADAAPYFRIFNPVSQGEKFDPNGDYVRQWVPELAGLPAARIHQPWTASAAELARAGVKLGASYPEPIVSLGISREVALDAYAKMRA